MADIADILIEIRAELRAGRYQRAHQVIKGTLRKRLGRVHRLALARYAREAGQPDIAVKLLHRLVRRQSGSPIIATDDERAEYAATLVKKGALAEGLELLHGVDKNKAPRALLYEAHALIGQWKYSESIPVLRRYMQFSLEPYDLLVAKINLAAALVHERRNDEADNLLSLLLEETSELPGLNATVILRLAEQSFNKKRWKDAEKFLQRASSFGREATGRGEFFIRKWATLVQFYQNPSGNLALLENFRREAVAKSHWETVRECDYHRAVVTFNSELLMRVYFGTPFQHYRKRLLADFGKPISIPRYYRYELGTGPSFSPAIDIVSGQFVPPRSPLDRLKIGQLKHRLLKFLSTDFYRPKTVAEVFAAIYPATHFSPNHSPTRIHQATKTLRRWLAANHFPLAVCQSGGYWLSAAPSFGCTIIVRDPNSGDEVSIDRLDEIRRRARDTFFTAKEVSDWLDIPRRSAFYLIQRALERRLVMKDGRGRSSRYRFSD